MADSQYLTVDHLTTKVIRRLFSKIQVDRATGCWNWTARTNPKGYGQVRFGNTTELAHRVVYAWLVETLDRPVARSPLIGILVIDHLCNNPRCVNPSHMQLSTSRDNTLRGNGRGARNARQTHCIRAHVLPEPNAQGMRPCRPCRLLYNALPRVMEKARVYQRNLRLRIKATGSQTSTNVDDP